jgi:TonB-dependent receptor
MKFYLSVFFSLMLSVVLSAQKKAGISGSVSDGSNKEALIGANVEIVGATTTNVVTDIDGKYLAEDLMPGVYKVIVTYLGFQESKTENITLKAGVVETVNIELKDASLVTSEVVVTAEASKKSIVGLMTLQQKSATIVTGISSDDIKKTPDRSASDVLKRLSGTSIQGGKFVIIRGLADRYNAATLNGLPLPSTEPDRRAFSFDLFPSSLLDNLMVYKTAAADLPGEFAGGVIQLNTKEVPDSKFFNFSVNGSFNSISTFKPYASNAGSSTDFLGFDNGERAMPKELQNLNIVDFQNRFNGTGDVTNQYNLYRQFKNDWTINQKTSMMPSFGAQASGGMRLGKFGFIAAANYGMTYRTTETERGLYNVDASPNFEFKDKQYSQTAALSGVISMAYRLNNKNSIQLNQIVSLQGQDITLERTGNQYVVGQNVRSNALQYTSTMMANTQIIGEHAYDNNAKLTWGLTYNILNRDIPNLRRMYYYTNDANNLTGGLSDSVWIAQMNGNGANPNYAGRFYSTLNEKLYGINVDYRQPYRFLGQKNLMKVGFLTNYKKRNFDARLVGYTDPSFNEVRRSAPQSELLNNENLTPDRFRMETLIQPTDSYTGEATNGAAYLQLEQNISKAFKAVLGFRTEIFNQKLITNDGATDSVQTNQTYLDLLPSVNLSYELSAKSKLRLSASSTVARPNFRELAPFSYYDFISAAAIVGNTKLERTKIWNADLRYEIYPTSASMFAVTGFYKYFDKPIEQTVSTPGIINYGFVNLSSAICAGIEIEFRQSLRFMGLWSKNINLNGNFAYIHSKADFSTVANIQQNVTNGIAGTQLQGQSPYVANLGLSYNHPMGLSGSVSYNQIGRRIFLRGDSGVHDVYENSRSIIDAQVGYKKGQFEVKATVGDLLNQKSVFYQDRDGNGKYNSDNDTRLQSYIFGTNVTLSLNYTF